MGLGEKTSQIRLRGLSRLHHPGKGMLVACCHAVSLGPLDSLGCPHVLSTPQNLHLRPWSEA